MTKKTEVAKSELDLFVEEKNLSVNFPNYKIFEEFLTQASEWKKKGMAIKITGIEQTTEMAQAREGRLILSRVRINIENKRKALKEESLRTGQAIDAVAKYLISAIEPIENHLKEQEKFVERLQEQKKREIESQRKEKLIAFCDDISYFDLLNMPEENFQNLLENSRLAYEGRIENERKVKEEAIRLEKINGRVNQINLLGFGWADSISEYKSKSGLPVSRQLLENCPDEEWNNFIQLAKEHISEFEYQQNQERLALAEENKKLQEAADLKTAMLKKRGDELRPYIMFIRDYNWMVNLLEDSYQKELADIKIAAEQHYESERKQIQEKARIDNENAEKLRIANEAKSKAERELKAKEEADKKAEAEKLAKIEAENAMGDKARMILFKESIEALRQKYTFKSKKYQKLGEQVEELLAKTTNFINEKI